ncbi:hypothetical protein SNE40_006358 [Patella caerulea]|uniref:Integrase catalytic domain-containing protein n=1 Tax=Patella caerulea TaxID=87958 RepID=A0AAN8JZW9_PATCE
MLPCNLIAIDIFGPLPITKNGNEYIMVEGDYYTKYVEAFAIPNYSALVVADKLLTKVICRSECPEPFHTDQGREFESILFSTMCEKLDVNKTRTTPYHPQSGGFVKRFNRTLRQLLGIFCNENQTDWDDFLPFLLMAYRNSVQKSTRCTPNLLMIRRESSCPIPLLSKMTYQIE